MISLRFKKILIFFGLLGYFLPVVTLASVDVNLYSRAGLYAVSNQSYYTEAAMTGRGLLLYYVGYIIKGVLAFVGTILAGIVIYAGYLWMTAGGNDDQIKKAKAWLRNGILGLLLIFFANIISGLIIGFAQQSVLSGTPPTNANFWPDLGKAKDAQPSWLGQTLKDSSSY